VTDYLRSLSPEGLAKFTRHISSSEQSPRAGMLHIHDASRERHEQSVVALCEATVDGQHFITETGPKSHEEEFGTPVFRSRVGGGHLVAYPADAAHLHRIYNRVAPGRLPRAMGPVSRLGIGTRMSRLLFEGIWRSINRCGYAANAFQNSYRELTILDRILNPGKAATVYYPGLGFVPEGHTGSTFEGLWVTGISEALKFNTARSPFGADADHIKVKRDDPELVDTRLVVEAARFYSFFTLDVSDVLDYSAYGQGSRSTSTLESEVGDSSVAREITRYYNRVFKIDGVAHRITENELIGLVGKYWKSLGLVEKLAEYISTVRGGEQFDLEISIDEHPPDVHPFECITKDAELLFLLEELRRRGVRVTHIAPNFGVEKHVDYRHPSGLDELAERVARQHAIARDYGSVLDCHSGDDLASETVRTFSAATSKEIHFKVSPSLQMMYADVLAKTQPNVFRIWWDKTCDVIERAAAEGSDTAVKFMVAGSGAQQPDPSNEAFRLFCFAAVGQRDDRGGYLLREALYEPSEETETVLAGRLEDHLCRLAYDLFGS
jgi:hypothetical protein